MEILVHVLISKTHDTLKWRCDFTKFIPAIGALHLNIKGAPENSRNSLTSKIERGSSSIALHFSCPMTQYDGGILHRPYMLSFALLGVMTFLCLMQQWQTCEYACSLSFMKGTNVVPT